MSLKKSATAERKKNHSRRRRTHPLHRIARGAAMFAQSAGGRVGVEQRRKENNIEDARAGGL